MRNIKKYRLAMVMTCLALAVGLGLTGCDDEEELEQATEQQMDDESAAENQETDASEVEAGGVTRGTGLVTGSASGSLDANPTRAIRRSLKPVQMTRGVMVNGAELPDQFYSYRNLLDANEQQAYNQLRNGLLNGAATIDLSSPVSPDRIFDVFRAVVFDSPDIFWAETNINFSYNNYGNVTTVTPVYNDLVNDREGATQAVNSAVGEALSVMSTLGTDIEKVKYAHDYLTSTVDYVSNSPYNQSAYSAFVNRQTVCAGYAHAFQYMMQKMGIVCDYTVGFAGENHAWNILQLDGEYYAMDVTWDDPVGAAPDQFRYDYFNITDSQLAKDHSREEISSPLPVAYGTAYSYQNAFNGNDPGTNFTQTGNGAMPAETNAVLAYEEEEDETPVYEDYTNLTGDSGQTEDWNLEDNDEGDGSGQDSWWNMLDSSWTKEDWTMENGWWTILDEETGVWYMYDEASRQFACQDEADGSLYVLDDNSGEWVEQ